MDRYDLILQPKTGTHVEHTMAALDGVSIPELRDGGRDLPHPDGSPCLHSPALKWCKDFGLDPDSQPDGLIEGACQDDQGYSCIEFNTVGFPRMIAEIYGIAKHQRYDLWDSMKLPADKMERHFLLLESDEDEDVVIPPTVTLQFVAKRELMYDVRVLSDGTYELRGTSPYVLGDRFHGAWYGPFPASEFPTMFPGSALPTTLSNPNGI